MNIVRRKAKIWSKSEDQVLAQVVNACLHLWQIILLHTYLYKKTKYYYFQNIDPKYYRGQDFPEKLTEIS